MLTTANSGYGIRTLRFWSFVGFINLKLDKNGLLVVSHNLTQVLLQRLWTLFGGLYTIYLFVRLVQVIQSDPSEWMHTFFTHLNLVLVATSALYWGHEFFFRSPELVVTIFNDSSQCFGTFRGRKALRRVLEMYPILWILLPTAMLLLYIENPLAPYTIYSGLLPKAQQTWQFSTACALTEYALMSFIMSQIYFGVFTILIFFQMVLLEQEDAMRELRCLPSDGSRELALELHIKRCRLFQLRISLFNKLFSHLLYCSKVLIMGLSILGIFFAIRIHESSLPAAAVSAYAALADSGTYIVMFHRAGDFSENIRNYKKEIRRLGKRTIAVPANSEDLGKFIECSLKSVKESGISFGGFYCFESVSALEFCDFVFNQAIGLLLTYREPIVVGPR